MLKMNKPFGIIAISSIMICGCGSAADSTDPCRYELPSVTPGEQLITYRGYSDIQYGNGTEIFSDPDKIAYTVSYDSKHKIPRWVAYDLTAEEMKGKASRDGKSYRPDEHAGVPQADNYDYRRSGWTRGHLAPAGDFRWSNNALDDTFYYTNCCPQTEYFNGTSWEQLENRVRYWAKRFGTVYIVTGPIIGNEENGKLGQNRISIPDAFFKALLVRDGNSFQSIAFVMHNTSLPQPYDQCAMSVDQLEEAIGLDLFCALDDGIESKVESSYSPTFWF